SDEDGTVEKVEISIKGGPWLPATGTESWSLEWNTEKVKNGDYTITVRSYDGKNYSLEKPITVKVENKEKNGGDGIIPGFEAVVAAAAVGAALLIYRRKRR
ncbi:MAG: hypothetical protein KAU14_03415, partial [Thermoplasmata archaeon]|nr:hypothetical protein [Thermoplasmata archaeon]